MQVLTPGARVGPYDVQVLIGRGGMGEVYRAHDARLKRNVALKVLPAALAADADRLARFEREAQVLASLNHPHIASIYGIEEANSTRALVMELVEGDTLADRISRGAIPVDEALRIGRQIAEALEAAHEQGIIHRDLKPANIKIKDNGTVKVLDFGLAKALERGESGVGTSMTQAVTITAPEMSTAVGVILGTAPYMSPEQVKGRPVDKRADIFAFGCVLYEMLTGKRAFDGEHALEVHARILEREPDWSVLPANASPGIRRLLERCLKKDSKERRRDAGDVIADIEDAAVPVVAAGRANSLMAGAGWVAAVTMAVALAGLGLGRLRGTAAPEPMREMRVEISTPATAVPEQFALSPDGTSIAFIASGDGQQRLWLRRFDRPTAVALPGSAGATGVSWSPDSRSIVFVASQVIQRLDLAGGTPVVLARGFEELGSWNSDGVILVSRASTIFRITATGDGQPAKVLEIPGGWILWPQFLPDGKQFLFSVFSGEPPIRGTYIGALDGRAPKRLGPAETGAAWLPPDRVVFATQGNLLARRLDLERLEWNGDPELIAESVGERIGRRGGFSVSPAGMIAYRKQASSSQLTWLDRKGQLSGAPLEPDHDGLVAPQLSPDGKRASLDRTVQGNRDIWLIDFSRGGMNRFTADAAADGYPVWFPDGNHLAFETTRNGDFDIYVKKLFGTEPEQPLVEGPGQQWPDDVSRDGRFLLFHSDGELWALPLEGDDRERIKVARGSAGQFSPDGRWVAFVTTDSGRPEVVVQTFPKPVGRWPVSTAGGMWPRWSASGKELYFVADGRMMASTIRAAGSSFEAAPPTVLFPVQLEGPPGGHAEYAVSPDGRFLLNWAADAGSDDPITLILNWQPKRPD